MKVRNVIHACVLRQGRRLQPALLGLAAVAVASVAWSITPPIEELDPAATESYQAANRAILQQRVEESVVLFEQALAIDPRFAEAHRGLGIAHGALGNQKLAQRHYEVYLLLRPEAEDAGRVRQIVAVYHSVDTDSQPATPHPNLEQSAILKTFQLRMHELKSCREAPAERAPSPVTGAIRVQLWVRPDGQARDVSVLTDSVKDKAVGACVKDTVSRWQFPRFRGTDVGPIKIAFSLE